MSQVDEWSRKAEAALRANNEQLARAALERKVQASRLADQYTQHPEQQEQQVERFSRRWCSLKPVSQRCRPSAI